MTPTAHTYYFDVENAKDFFHKIVIPQHDEFLSTNSSSRHAILAILATHHLYEWVHKRSFNTEHFKLKYPDDSELAEVFELARLISNGVKHFSLKVVTRRQRGFSSGFSNGFARPLVVELSDDKDLSVDELLRRMVDFWHKQEKLGAFQKKVDRHG